MSLHILVGFVLIHSIIGIWDQQFHAGSECEGAEVLLVSGTPLTGLLILMRKEWPRQIVSCMIVTKFSVCARFLIEIQWYRYWSKFHIKKIGYRISHSDRTYMFSILCLEFLFFFNLLIIIMRTVSEGQQETRETKATVYKNTPRCTRSIGVRIDVK